MVLDLLTLGTNKIKYFNRNGDACDSIVRLYQWPIMYLNKISFEFLILAINSLNSSDGVLFKSSRWAPLTTYHKKTAAVINAD